MTARVDVQAIDIDDKWETTVDFVINTTYSLLGFKISHSKKKMRMSPTYIHMSNTMLLPVSFNPNNAAISAGTSQKVM